MARGAHGTVEHTVVRAAELPFEFMMNALRLNDGFSTELYESRTGLALPDISERLQRLQQRGLLEENAGQWRTTTLGGEFLNEVLLEFMDMPRAARTVLRQKKPEGPQA
jgi:oxygen-independent coproporphyrinogen-3 oxidase